MPLALLKESLNVAQVRAWLGMLIAENRNANQAKSTIITLAELLAEDKLIKDDLVHKLKNIDMSGLRTRKLQRRILHIEEIEVLVNSLENPTSAMALRDAVVVSLLLILRIKDVADAKWKNIHQITNPTHFKNIENLIKLPEIATKSILQWYNYLTEIENNAPDNNSFVIRRFMKGDTVTQYGVIPKSLTDILNSVSERAGIGVINADELRMSVKRITKSHGITSMF